MKKSIKILLSTCSPVSHIAFLHFFDNTFILFFRNRLILIHYCRHVVSGSLTSTPHLYYCIHFLTYELHIYVHTNNASHSLSVKRLHSPKPRTVLHNCRKVIMNILRAGTGRKHRNQGTEMCEGGYAGQKMYSRMVQIVV